MATYVLVHGAWSGSQGYRRVARGLRAAGHEVFTPTLTGLGERTHLSNPGITLDVHVQDVIGVIEHEDLDDIILCGHSYGGMVVTGVAAWLGARVRTLIYLDAFLPEDGQSLWDLADEPARRHYIDAQAEHPGLVAPFSWGDTLGRRRQLHPLLTLTQPVRIGEAGAVRNRTYIYATRDAPTIFTQFHERVKDDPEWRVHEIDTGHIVMLDDPEGLTAMLLAEADR